MLHVLFVLLIAGFLAYVAKVLGDKSFPEFAPIVAVIVFLIVGGLGLGFIR